MCLQVKPWTLIERLRKDSRRRPLLVGRMEEKLRDLLEQRSEHYGSFALKVGSSELSEGESQLTPEQIALVIQSRLNLLHVSSGGGKGYDVIVQPGGIDALGDLMRGRKLGNPVAVVADKCVAMLYATRLERSLEAAGYKVHRIEFLPGEKSKTLETVMRLWQGMADSGLDRGSTLVALGGGVTGDLAGFAASTFMRGIQWVCVPTTLLAMVDSCLGGKTGVDLPQGKNLAGSFHDPALVLADPQVLASLPARQISAGMAEVIKHGMIGDPGLLRLAESGWDACRAVLPELIRRAMAVKIRIIEKDPLEIDLRRALNLGHTIGHAVEVASEFELLHGEAVAIGLVAETQLAESLGIAERDLTQKLASLLGKFGLPVHIPDGIPVEAILKAMQVDKKRSGGQVQFSLPVRMGEVKTGVDGQDLERALNLILRSRNLGSIDDPENLSLIAGPEA